MSKPLIIAHRGASEYVKENTLEAIELAVAQGADMVELDVRVTKDQVLVINHNDRLKSFRPTIKIRNHTYQELVDLGFTLPKLEEIFPYIPPHILLNLDLKNTDMDLALGRLIQSKNLEQRIYFDSNNALLLERYEIFFPEAKYVLNSALSFDPFNMSGTLIGSLFAFLIPLALVFFSRILRKRRVKNFLPTHVSLVPRMCTKGNIDFFHSLGVAVLVSPVNKPHNMKKFIDRGVDGIKTDRPDVLYQVVNDAFQEL